MEDKKILDKITGPIAEIIDLELERGNDIVEVSEGWPWPNANVWLKLRFHKNYLEQFQNIEYRLVDDPHYWYDEYTDEEKGFFVGTRF